jgi:hypothetical protein
MGTGPIGMAKNAPTAVNAANKDAYTIIRNCFEESIIYDSIRNMSENALKLEVPKVTKMS